MRVLFRIFRIAVWLLILLAIIALAYLRILGVPKPIQQRFVDELQKKGIAVRFGKIYFDPFSGFVATDAVLFNPRYLEQELIRVDEIGLRLDYQKLREKQQAIEELQVDGASLTLPLDLRRPEESTVTGTSVSASLRVEEGGIIAVDNLNGIFNGIRVSLSGTVRAFDPGGQIAEAFRPQPGTQPNLLAKIVDELQTAEFRKPPEVHVQFHADLVNPGNSTAQALVKCERFRHDKLVVESVNVQLALTEQIVRLQRFDVVLYGGRVEVEGEYDIATGIATVDVHSDTNIKRLAEAVGGRWRNFFRDYEFAQNPIVTGKMEVRPRELGLVVANGQLEINRMRFRGVPLHAFRSKFTLRDGIFRLPNFEAVRPEGTFVGTYTCRLSTEDFTLDAVSNVHPAPVRGIFPNRQAEFLRRFRFESPPQIIFLWTGNWANPDASKIRSRVRGGAFTIDGVPMRSLDADAELDGHILSVTNLVLVREEGQVSGHVVYNVESGRMAGGLVSTANPYDIAKAIGSNAVAAIAPYQFIQPPRISLAGVLNFKDDTETDVRGHIEGNHLYYWRLHADTAASDITIRKNYVALTNLNAQLYGGSLDGEGEFFVDGSETRYRVSAEVAKTDLQQLTQSITLKKLKSTGLLSGGVSLRGNVSDLRTTQGAGHVEIAKAVLWEHPVFGSLLSNILNTLLPGKIATSTATEAHGEFVIEDGVVNFSRLQVDAGLTSLVASGRYKLWSGGLDMEVEGRPWNESVLAKPFTLVLMPFTKLFTLHLGGTWEKPEWRTVYLPKEIFSPFKTGSTDNDKAKPVEGWESLAPPAVGDKPR